MNYLHFCGGLPRSGSTVLMNILQQNPKIFTTGTCALYEILHEKILIKSRYAETFQAMSVEQADRAIYGLIHGATKGWFEALTNKPTVISKRHGWSNLFHLFPKSKFICVVRDLRDIVESFEKINSKSLALHSYSSNFSFVPAMNDYEKYNYYFKETNSFSASLNIEIPRMLENHKNGKVIFLRYEDFIKDPIFVLKDLYNFLNEDWFEHNLNDISQSELFEHDHAYFRERTDHKTISTFRQHQENRKHLSNNLEKMILENNKDFYKIFYPDAISTN